MKLGDFRKQTKDLDDQVVLTVAEVDEAASINVPDAKLLNREANGQEPVELGTGSQKAIVLRY